MLFTCAAALTSTWTGLSYRGLNPTDVLLVAAGGVGVLAGLSAGHGTVGRFRVRFWMLAPSLAALIPLVMDAFATEAPDPGGPLFLLKMMLSTTLVAALVYGL